MGRYRHVGHTGGVCGLVRPSAAPSQVDGRSWERPFQRRDAKCVTLCISEGASTSLFAFQRHSLHFIRLSRLRFARDLLMMVHPRGTSATSGLKITAELVAIDRGASLSAVSLIGCLLFCCSHVNATLATVHSIDQLVVACGWHFFYHPSWTDRLRKVSEADAFVGV